MSQPIVRYPVASSNLAAVGYHEESRTLHVEFKPTAKKGQPLPKRGRVIEYDGVPPELFNAFIAAPSLGTFYHGALRGKFNGHDIDAPAIGTCPKCGNFGLAGCKCDDCGCDEYRDDAV